LSYCRELLTKLKLRPHDILRKNESIFRELGLTEKKLTDDQLISLMIEHPDLIQRPIIERGNRAALGRPLENVKSIL